MYECQEVDLHVKVLPVETLLVRVVLHVLSSTYPYLELSTCRDPTILLELEFNLAGE